MAAVERGSRRTRQNRDGFDIFGIDVGNGLRRTVRVVSRTAFAAEVIHRDAVDNVQCVRRLVDTLRTAHDDLRGAAHARRRGVDVHAGDLAAERIDEVDIFHGHDILAVHFLNIVRKSLFRALDTQRSHHHGIHVHGRLPKGDPEIGAAADDDIHRLIAQVVNRKHGLRGGGGYLERESAVHVGAHADRSTFDDHGYADHPLSRGIDDNAAHGNCLCRFADGPAGEDDRSLFYRIGDIGGPEQALQHAFQRHGLDIERDFARDVDALVIHEKIGGLFLDCIEHLFQGNVRHPERHRHGLGTRRHGKKAAHQRQNRQEQTRPRLIFHFHRFTYLGLGLSSRQEDIRIGLPPEGRPPNRRKNSVQAWNGFDHIGFFFFTELAELFSGYTVYLSSRCAYR